MQCHSNGSAGLLGQPRVVLIYLDSNHDLFKKLVDLNNSQEIKKLDIKVKMQGSENFFPDEVIFEGLVY